MTNIFFRPNIRLDRLCGRHVCITGGSQGIGKCLGLNCIARNVAKLSILSRSIDNLAKAEQQFKQYSGIMKSHTEINVFSCDVSNSHHVKLVFTKIKQKCGPIEVLICSAGVCISDQFTSLSESECRTMINTNTLGTIYSIKAVLTEMKQMNWGVICVILSQAAHISLYGFSVYGASKCALLGLCNSLRMELSKYNINLIAAFPSDVDTPGFEKENVRKPKILKIMSSFSSIYSPDDVASKILQSIEQGDSNVIFGLTGKILSIASCGGDAPSGRILNHIIEITFMGLCRLIVIIFHFIVKFWVKIFMQEVI